MHRGTQWELYNGVDAGFPTDKEAWDKADALDREVAALLGCEELDKIEATLKEQEETGELAEGSEAMAKFDQATALYKEAGAGWGYTTRTGAPGFGQAVWGCMWYQLWVDQTEKGIADGQVPVVLHKTHTGIAKKFQDVPNDDADKKKNKAAISRDWLPAVVHTDARDAVVRGADEEPLGDRDEARWDWEGVGNSQKGEIKYLRERGIPIVHYDIAQWPRFAGNSKRGASHDAEARPLSAWLAQVPTHPEVVNWTGNPEYGAPCYKEGIGKGTAAEVAARIAAQHGDVFAALAGTAGLGGEDVDVAELARRLPIDQLEAVFWALVGTHSGFAWMLLLRLHWELRCPIGGLAVMIEVEAHPPGLSPLSQAEIDAAAEVAEEGVPPV